MGTLITIVVPMQPAIALPIGQTMLQISVDRKLCMDPPSLP
jgi:hypothetical protein